MNRPKHLAAVLALVITAVLPSIALRGDDAKPQAAQAYPASDVSKAKLVPVLRVVDGDTIEVELDGEKEKVRLVGVDTPETVAPRKPVEQYGKEASAFTRNLLTGESVYLLPDQGNVLKRDRYGRLLAYVYRAPDGLFVNLEIVRQGYGHAYTKYPHPHLELFRAYERRADEADKGLWAPVKP